MEIDLELYRREVRISEKPLIRLSAIDIAPERPQRTIVFIPGFGGEATQFVYQLNEFSLNNRVIGLDLRGHGKSDRLPGEFTMAEIQADLSAALDVLKAPEKLVLIGHSFGGAVAAEYAAAHPERVDRLVLIATAGEFRLNFFLELLLSLPNPILRAAGVFTRQWLHAPPVVLRPLYKRTLATWAGWSRFRDLRTPTLVIRGARDIVFAAPLFEEVARAIPGAEELNVGASGHKVMLERRDAVNRAIKRFLEETPSSWRRDPSFAEASERASLLLERPWLAHYDEDVPFTISIPEISLHRLLRSAVRRFPLRPAILFEGQRISYRRLNQEANRFANALRSLGLAPGDRVWLWLPNIPQAVIAYFGILKAGGVAVFALPDSEPERLNNQIRDSGARIGITLTRFGDTALTIREQTPLEQLILTDAAAYLPAHKRLLSTIRSRAYVAGRQKLEPIEGVYRFQSLLYRHSKQAPEITVNPEDIALVQYTGGTTAEPRGVVLTHRNLVANTLQTRHWMPDAQEGRERFLSVLPFGHIYGLTTALNLPIALGAMLILKPQFEVQDVLRTIRRAQPSIFPGVPNMYVALKDFPGVRKYRISSIRACLSGAAPLPVEVQEAFEKLTRGRLVEGYGLTEASPVTHANPLRGRRKVGTIGIPLPSTEARIVGLTDRRKAVPVGQLGELAVRGPQVMRGYWNDPLATGNALTPDGWLLTGDVAQMDAEGYFRIVARKADLWYPSRPGQPAFPRDVEEVLYEVPHIKEAAVVAIAGQPIAFVIAGREKPPADSLIAYCRRRLPPELVPKVVIFVEEFPRSFIGKVLRRELARRYEHQHAEQ